MLDFLPHGSCYLWDKNLIAAHAAADILIALAYYSIPISLLMVWVAVRRAGMSTSMYVMFASFIAACGTTHLMEVLIIWWPWYWLAAAVKAITAGLSVTTAAIVIYYPKRLLGPVSNGGPKDDTFEQARARLAHLRQMLEK